ncbi:MAG: archaeal proteasome endopeptidase complex subunit beta [Desulfurococcales archaeon]|nr:archaeal proteasome endopeptidase complex subunit beta [Desulfurococcales archaeon]
MVHRMKSVMHGTTTVGLKIRDAVILAADKRASQGYYVAHKKVKKIVKIDDHVAMTTAGLVADAQMLASHLSLISRKYRIENNARISIKALASYLSILLNSSKYFPYEVQLLIGGYDSAPRLYALTWFGDLFEENYTVTGSGSPVAVGVLETGFSEDLSVDEAVELAVKAVRSAIKRDVFTGEAVDVAVIDKEGVKFLSFGKE